MITENQAQIIIIFKLLLPFLEHYFRIYLYVKQSYVIFTAISFIIAIAQSIRRDFLMIIFNNQFVKREEAVVDIEDRGYQFGDGVYEVMRIYEGQMFAFKEHAERLVRSAKEIEIELPFTVSELKEKLTKLIQENNVLNGIVYLQVTRGAAPRTHFFPKNPQPVFTAYTASRERMLTEMTNGIDVMLHEDIRWHRCDIKSLNLLPNTLAFEKAVRKGCQEAILHRGDIVTEASSSNVFIVKDGILKTHPANHFILNGITRGKVIELADELGIPLEEKPFTVQDLLEADEAFISNTGIEIGPINHVDGQAIGYGKPGEITRKLQEAFENILPKKINA